ncbi:carboxylic acid transporter [Artomyces pyxidatus]|uniref:Carboxylic acid transporter n=1 Tax=Artomyces pyxidatus TaxID=48021 RepID=A0ACB8SUI1_9AGAM|nr:carboxylic acid transporter [Artomyces pyxidatus]
MASYFLRNIVPNHRHALKDRPILHVLFSLTWIQWALLFSGWLAWTCDAIDFFSVSLSVTRLQTQFKKPKASTITTAITLTLLFRPMGAAIFGTLSDRFGRKWPLVLNLLLCAVFELGSGFVQTFHQFLAVRSLFGIAMGGIWGLASSTALENLPVEVRGLASGVLQEGYAAGYLFAAVMNLRLVPETTATWRSLFWAASGISLFAACVRAVLPESSMFLRAKAAERARGTTTAVRTGRFWAGMRVMLKKHWAYCIYAVLLTAGLSFLSHGSQDLYPTYLTKSKGFNNYQSTVATIIGNCGAIAGGAAAGFSSQYIGRRLAMAILVLLAGAFIPLWILPTSFGALSAGAFFIQFGVQGALGVVPIQLAELSPPAFRATFPGVAYQFGAMVASASSQIEATGGDHLKTTLIVDGKPTTVPNYATVQGIFIGIAAVFTLFVIILGPENHGSHFEKHKVAFEEDSVSDELVVEHDAERKSAGSQYRREIDEKETADVAVV